MQTNGMAKWKSCAASTRQPVLPLHESPVYQRDLTWHSLPVCLLPAPTLFPLVGYHQGYQNLKKYKTERSNTPTRLPTTLVTHWLCTFILATEFNNNYLRSPKQMPRWLINIVCHSYTQSQHPSHPQWPLPHIGRYTSLSSFRKDWANTISIPVRARSNTVTWKPHQPFAASLASRISFMETWSSVRFCFLLPSYTSPRPFTILVPKIMCTGIRQSNIPWLTVQLSIPHVQSSSGKDDGSSVLPRPHFRHAAGHLIWFPQLLTTQPRTTTTCKEHLTAWYSAATQTMSPSPQASSYHAFQHHRHITLRLHLGQPYSLGWAQLASCWASSSTNFLGVAKLV